MGKISKKSVLDEIERLKATSENEIVPAKRGRPKPNGNTVKTNLDLTVEFLKELDNVATHLNISRQALIKVWLRDKLDDHYTAKKVS